jgi:hypothetical protein
MYKFVHIILLPALRLFHFCSPITTTIRSSRIRTLILEAKREFKKKCKETESGKRWVPIEAKVALIEIEITR